MSVRPQILLFMADEAHVISCLHPKGPRSPLRLVEVLESVEDWLKSRLNFLEHHPFIAVFDLSTCLSNEVYGDLHCFIQRTNRS